MNLQKKGVQSILYTCIIYHVNKVFLFYMLINITNLSKNKLFFTINISVVESHEI